MKQSNLTGWQLKEKSLVLTLKKCNHSKWAHVQHGQWRKKNSVCVFDRLQYQYCGVFQQEYKVTMFSKISRYTANTK